MKKHSHECYPHAFHLFFYGNPPKLLSKPTSISDLNIAGLLNYLLYLDNPWVSAPFSGKKKEVFWLLSRTFTLSAPNPPLFTPDPAATSHSDLGTASCGQDLYRSPLVWFFLLMHLSQKSRTWEKFLIWNRKIPDLNHNDVNQDTTSSYLYSASAHLNELQDIQAFLLFGFHQ